MTPDIPVLLYGAAWSADINTIIQASIKMLMWAPCQTKIKVSTPGNDAEGENKARDSVPGPGELC